jgi:hypothetical protein
MVSWVPGSPIDWAAITPTAIAKPALSSGHADFHDLAGGEIATVAQGAGAARGGAGQNRANAAWAYPWAARMPKLYEYFGVLVMFYSNEHEPVHVHGKFQGRESRAELILIDGLVTEIRYRDVTGRAPLGQSEMRYFEEIVSARAAEIVTKWIDFFVLHKPIKPEHITRRLK